MSQTLLSTLPIEIFQEILNNISIKECKNILEAYEDRKQSYSCFHPDSDFRTCTENHFRVKDIWYDKISKAVETRINIPLYLSQHFPDAKGLLEIMLYNDIHISGSRALDFFTGDAVGTTSDWDFYIPFDKIKIVNFMEYMKRNKVTWLSTMEYFEQQLNTSENDISLTVEELMYLEQQISLVTCDTYTVNAINNLCNKYRYYYERTSLATRAGNIALICKNKNQLVRSVTIQDSEYQKLEIIRGVLTYRDSKTNIQLMLVENETNGVLNTLLEFHTSIVQCFINGFCALHMYKRDAYSRNSKLWLTQYSETDFGSIKVDASVQKYKKRGYKFRKTPINNNELHSCVRSIKRCIGDEGCEIVTFNDSNNTSDNNPDYCRYLREKMNIMYSFSWLQDGTRLDHDHFENMRKHRSQLRYRDKIVEKICETIREESNSNISRNKILLYSLVNNIQLYEFNYGLLTAVETKHNEIDIDLPYYSLFQPLKDKSMVTLSLR